MNYKITAPNDTTSVIGNRHSSNPLWLILGIAYTDSEAVVAYAERRGLTVETVDEIPIAYLEQSARLTAFGIRVNTGAADGADPGQKYRVTGPDGQTQVDIRDVINGRITA